MTSKEDRVRNRNNSGEKGYSTARKESIESVIVELWKRKARKK